MSRAEPRRYAKESIRGLSVNITPKRGPCHDTATVWTRIVVIPKFQQAPHNIVLKIAVINKQARSNTAKQRSGNAEKLSIMSDCETRLLLDSGADRLNIA